MQDTTLISLLFYHTHTFLFKQTNADFSASKQMVYGVYGNVINIMEEFERRESRTALPGSSIYGPDQSRKGNEDVRL